jgi:Fur family transcriptional regulator, ferric uptake regulator
MTPSDVHPSPQLLLQRSGLRRTPVRMAVIDVLTRGGRPMTVPQILGKMKGTVDTVTVYRTLHTFARKKLVHRVRGEDRSWLYAISGGESDRPREHLHPHFVCDECGKVECLETSRIPSSFVASLDVGGGYEVRWPEVVLHGLCPKCHA